MEQVITHILSKAVTKPSLIDTVDPTKTHELLDNLEKLDVNIDYLIVNHGRTRSFRKYTQHFRKV